MDIPTYTNFVQSLSFLTTPVRAIYIAAGDTAVARTLLANELNTIASHCVAMAETQVRKLQGVEQKLKKQIRSIQERNDRSTEDDLLSALNS